MRSFSFGLLSSLLGRVSSHSSMALAVISGSLGLSPSASVGGDIGLFEPIHGSYPQVANQNKAIRKIYSYSKINLA